MDGERVEPEDRLITGDELQDEAEDTTIRPATFDEFIGQEGVKETLRIALEATRQRGEPLDHILFSGPPGLGKTTLAHLIAREMNAQIHTTSGPILEKPGDMAAMLTLLGRGDVLFIDEIHRLPRIIEEILYPAMEDYRIEVMIGEGPSARSITLTLEHFTLVGATTRVGLLGSPFRDRFGLALRLNLYTPEELSAVVRRSAGIMQIP
ncbi:MAG: Holliday junction branch migration DNA helicase RuvB, partial [Methanomicrobiales archaeon]|nr:Holliday junction branch migration DNA helicase RuvB [Methanomicrobiales archaeon]